MNINTNTNTNTNTTRKIFCQKFQEELEGLERPPLPGTMGEKIFNHISKQAWEAWLGHQTMLINEYRLSMIDPKSKAFLATEREKFLFGTGSDKPAGFVPI